MYTRYWLSGCCILVLLAHLYERLLTTLQRRNATKYMLHCFQSKISLVGYGSMERNMEENFSMEWKMEENFSMEWKILGMEWKWNERKLPIWNMEKSSSIPFYTMPWLSSRPTHTAQLRLLHTGKYLQCL